MYSTFVGKYKYMHTLGYYPATKIHLKQCLMVYENTYHLLQVRKAV